MTAVTITEAAAPTVADIAPGDCFTTDGVLWMRATPDGTGSVAHAEAVGVAFDSIPGGPWVPAVCLHPPFVGQVSVFAPTVPVLPADVRISATVREAPKQLRGH